MLSYINLLKITKRELAKEIAEQTTVDRLLELAATTLLFVWGGIATIGISVLLPFYEFVHTSATVAPIFGSSFGSWANLGVLQGAILIVPVLVLEIMAGVLYGILWYLTKPLHASERKSDSRTARFIKTTARAVFSPALAACTLTIYMGLSFPIGFSQGEVPGLTTFVSFFGSMLLTCLSLTFSAGVVIFLSAFFIIKFFSDLPILFIKSTNSGMDEDELGGQQALLLNQVANRVSAALQLKPTAAEVEAVEERIERRLEALDLQPQALSGATSVLALLGILSLVVSQDQIKQIFTLALVMFAPSASAPDLTVVFILATVFCLIFVLLARVYLGTYRELRVLEIMREVCASFPVEPVVDLPPPPITITLRLDKPQPRHFGHALKEKVSRIRCRRKAPN